MAEIAEISATEVAKRIYTRYIDGILRGEDQYTAARGANVDPKKIEEFVRDANTDPMFHSLMRDALEGLDLHMLWNEKLHALALLRLATATHTKDVARIAALDRLAALFKIDTIEAPKAGALPDWREILNMPRVQRESASDPAKDEGK
jgi:hypothetical protein